MNYSAVSKVDHDAIGMAAIYQSHAKYREVLNKASDEKVHKTVGK